MRSRKMDGEEMRTPGDARALGLCATCNSVDTCTRRKGWCGPVLFCEEFDDYVELPARKERPPVVALSDSVPEVVQRLAGLCINCANRESCTLPKAEGGVWHCEEYE